MEPDHEFKIQIVSDLHTEMPGTKILEVLDELSPHCDNIALCGDIGKPGTAPYMRVIADCALNYKNVFVTLGNHEYYKSKMSTVDETFESLSEMFANVHPMNRREVTIDGVRILGCTLWSHVPDEAANDVETFLNDYRLIYKKHIGDGDDRMERITINDTNAFHKRDVDWLTSKLDHDVKTPTVVLTHHAPLMKGTSHPMYENPPKLTNHAFCTDMSGLMRGNVKLWAFGHTHHQNDFMRGGTRIVTNARGYNYREKANYTPSRVHLLRF